MSLQGQIVRIIVHKPESWDKGNLFGVILSDRGGQKIILQLAQKIVGKEFSSDIIEIQPLTEKETFKSLGQYYSVMVNAKLKSNETEKLEFIFSGSVTLD